MVSSPQSNGLSPHGADTNRAPLHRSIKQFRGCSRIADYEVLGKLGEGTFGYLTILQVSFALANPRYLLSEVHRARSRKTGAIVALKKILMHNEKDGVGPK
jgi:serine/threonine-protein kinase BUR1